MHSVDYEIEIGGKTIPLDGIAFIELHSGELADVQLNDGTRERLCGKQASSLSARIAASGAPKYLHPRYNFGGSPRRWRSSVGRASDL
jgi:hypothetical protein